MMAVMGGGALHVVVRFYAAVEQREGVRVRLERVDAGKKRYSTKPTDSLP